MKVKMSASVLNLDWSENNITTRATPVRQATLRGEGQATQDHNHRRVSDHALSSPLYGSEFAPFAYIKNLLNALLFLNMTTPENEFLFILLQPLLRSIPISESLELLTPHYPSIVTEESIKELKEKLCTAKDPKQLDSVTEKQSDSVTEESIKELKEKLCTAKDPKQLDSIYTDCQDLLKRIAEQKETLLRLENLILESSSLEEKHLGMRNLFAVLAHYRVMQILSSQKPFPEG